MVVIQQITIFGQESVTRVLTAYNPNCKISVILTNISLLKDSRNIVYNIWKYLRLHLEKHECKKDVLVLKKYVATSVVNQEEGSDQRAPALSFTRNRYVNFTFIHHTNLWR